MPCTGAGRPADSAGAAIEGTAKENRHGPAAKTAGPALYALRGTNGRAKRPAGMSRSDNPCRTGPSCLRRRTPSTIRARSTSRRGVVRARTHPANTSRFSFLSATAREPMPLCCRHTRGVHVFAARTSLRRGSFDSLHTSHSEEHACRANPSNRHARTGPGRRSACLPPGRAHIGRRDAGTVPPGPAGLRPDDGPLHG
jgi:hypothetical protein